MDYELMLELTGIDFTLMYDEVLVFQGLDTAIIPLQGGDWPDYSRWHLWRTLGKRIKMKELHMKTGREKARDLEKFKGKSVSVGWVVESRFLIGTSHSATASDLSGSEVETVGKLLDKS